jgi:hypothetical protein
MPETTHAHKNNEKFTSTQLEQHAVLEHFSNTAAELDTGSISVIIAIVVVLVIALTISIILTVFGHKARMKCLGNSRFGYYSPLIIAFLIVMWIGGPFSLVGLIGTIVMIVMANNNCKGKR